ncbi:MAG: TIM-barrel domain-containing protein [Roseburia sp.]
MGQESSTVRGGCARGLFLKTCQMAMYGSGICGSRDLPLWTLPIRRRAKWYGKKLEALLDMGVDCFKTDFGERIPTDAVYYDGSDPVKMHNYYTYLYNKAVL